MHRGARLDPGGAYSPLFMVPMLTILCALPLALCACALARQARLCGSRSAGSGRATAALRRPQVRAAQPGLLQPLPPLLWEKVLPLLGPLILLLPPLLPLRLLLHSAVLLLLHSIPAAAAATARPGR